MIAHSIKKLKEMYKSNKNSCRIVDFDPEKQEAIFQMKMKSSVFRVFICDAVNNISLIESLSPEEACWLGGYYGRYAKTTKKQNEAFLCANFVFSQKRYQILSFNRENIISYFDKITKRTLSSHVSKIVFDTEILSFFDNTQACYIGFLAGLLFEKELLSHKKTKEPMRFWTRQEPILSIVR